MQGRVGLALFVLIWAGLWIAADSRGSAANAAARRSEELDHAAHEDDLPAIQALVASHTVCGTPCHALHIAVRHGNLKIVDLLLRDGIDPNLAVECGRTPLMDAAQFGKNAPESPVTITWKLLKAGAKVNAIDCLRRTPLDYAIMNGNSEIAAMIRAAGGEQGIALS